MTLPQLILGIKEHGLEFIKRYYSIYRGIVVTTVDDAGLGRIRIIIPEIWGQGYQILAFPRNFYSGKEFYLKALPEPGDMVWVEFEGGNKLNPVWSFMYPLGGTIPQEIWDKDNIFLQTKYGHTVEFEEGLITITHKDGLHIKLTSTNIQLGGEDYKLIKPVALQAELDKINNNIENLKTTTKDGFSSLNAAAVPAQAVAGLTALILDTPDVNNTLNDKVTH